MDHPLTRRAVLTTIGTGATVAIAGCGSDDSTDNADETGIDEPEDDTEDPEQGRDTEQPSDEEEPPPDELDDILYIASDEEYVLDGDEQYDGIEIEPSGLVLVNPGGSLTLTEIADT